MILQRRDIEQSADALLTALHGPSFRTWGGMDVSPITARGIRLPQGQESRTVHILSVRTHDGLTLWQGRFMRRLDAQRFWAHIQRGEVPHELWDIPFPAWPSGLNEVLDIPGLEFAFGSQSYLVTTSASNQTYNVPSNYNSANNTWEVVGGGASGGVSGGTSTRKASGGGSGGYSLKNNVVLTPGGTALFNLQAAAAGIVASTGSVGNAGSPAWFNGSTQVASSVAANGGGAGQFGTVASVAAGAAASTTGAIGDVKTAGAPGGSLATTTGSTAATGGGGASGPNGAGNNGGNTVTNSQTIGGAGDGGFGGAAGAAGGSPGNAGTEFQDGVHGCGGGGGGNLTGTSGGGGKYGGASGGAANTSAVSSAAAAAAIIVGSWNVVLVMTNRRIYSYRR